MYRLAYFQAKRAGTQVDFYRAPKGPKAQDIAKKFHQELSQGDSPMLDRWRALFSQLEARNQPNLNAEERGWLNFVKERKRGVEPPLLQISRLFRNQNKWPKQPWCYYALWHEKAGAAEYKWPTVSSVMDVVEVINSQRKWEFAPALLTASLDFIDFVLSMFDGSTGLLVPLARAEEIIGHICELSPKVRFGVVDDSSGGGLIQEMAVMSSSFPKPLLSSVARTLQLTPNPPSFGGRGPR